MRSLLFLLLFIVPAALVHAGDFEDANQLWEQGKFEQARQRYEAIVERGEANANVYYNLGNSLHRLRRFGEAALNYHRALSLQPGHPEAQANLGIVRGLTGAIEWPRQWWSSAVSLRWVDVYSVAGAVGAWAAIFALVSIFTRRSEDRGGAWTLVILGVLIASASGAAIWLSSAERNTAIVVERTANAFLAPAESAGSAGTLPAGSEVRVIGERGDWVYCELPTQGRGWLPSRGVIRVRPLGT